LLAQKEFDAGFNSRNSAELAAGAYEVVVCAAAPGSMLHANKFPERDKLSISNVMAVLSRIRARRFVLISTIGVLQDYGSQADEETVRFETDRAYGVHRRELEVFCQGHFENCLIIRLPALCGDGLKKNLLFDISNPCPSYVPAQRYEDWEGEYGAEFSRMAAQYYGWSESLQMYELDRDRLNSSATRSAFELAIKSHQLDAVRFTNPQSSFQFYHLKHLWADIEKCEALGIKVMHAVSEPLWAGDIYRALLQTDMPSSASKLHHEDVWTRHVAAWGQSGHYIRTGQETLGELKSFFDSTVRPS